MQTEIIIAGFGGQGVLFAGQLLAYCALDEGLEVTWMPSYGPEMRGGTANCTVIISDEEIGSPAVRNPKGVLALNLPSFDKYEPRVVEGGVMVVNSSLVNREFERDDITGILIPANEMAEKLGNKRLTNIVMMGSLLAELPVLSLETLYSALDRHIPKRHRNLLDMNKQALREGFSFAKNKEMQIT